MIYLVLWLLVLGVSAAQAQTIIQDTYGWCSPAVGQAGGNVTINCQQPEKGYVLRGARGGAAAIVDSPNLANLVGKDASKHVVCLVPAGTPIAPTGRKESIGGLDMWQEVMVTAGDCANKVGWAARENLHWEQPL
jgi:hypothetical protein